MPDTDERFLKVAKRIGRALERITSNEARLAALEGRTGELDQRTMLFTKVGGSEPLAMLTTQLAQPKPAADVDGLVAAFVRFTWPDHGPPPADEVEEIRAIVARHVVDSRDHPLWKDVAEYQQRQDETIVALGSQGIVASEIPAKAREMRSQRDEARAEVERLRERLMGWEQGERMRVLEDIEAALRARVAELEALR